MSELHWLSALELRERFGRRELSPVEVAEALLERIDALNPSLTAYVTVTHELARSQAQEAEAAYARGDERPLLGVPISIKDLVATKGVRTTSGSLLERDRVPEEDDPIVERVYAAGAVLLGKTNLGEFGWKGDSGNRLVGPTHNPWRHGRTAGGSSGGAGAAVAAGLGPLAQGGDASGSIRMPSAFCGIFGLKTSFGAIPYFPPSGVEALAVRGPMTRTVRDAALLLDVLAGPDPRDRNSWLAPEVDYLAAVEGGVEGLRVAWSPDLGYARVDPDVAALTTAAARVFEELGCAVEEVTPPFPDPYPIVDTIRGAGSAAAHDDLDAVRADLDPGRLAWIERSLALTGADVARAESHRARYGHELRQFLAPYDLLLTPTVPVTAFEAGADGPPGFDGPESFLRWASFSYPFNLSGQPAASVPCGLAPDGLPVGLQLVGRFREDATVLRAAAAFEEARPWAHLRPPLAAAPA